MKDRCRPSAGCGRVKFHLGRGREGERTREPHFQRCAPAPKCSSDPPDPLHHQRISTTCRVGLAPPIREPTAATLDHFVPPCHSRAGGNLIARNRWSLKEIPACAGMTIRRATGRASVPASRNLPKYRPNAENRRGGSPTRPIPSITIEYARSVGRGSPHRFTSRPQAPWITSSPLVIPAQAGISSRGIGGHLKRCPPARALQNGA